MKSSFAYATRSSVPQSLVFEAARMVSKILARPVVVRLLNGKDGHAEQHQDCANDPKPDYRLSLHPRVSASCPTSFVKLRTAGRPSRESRSPCSRGRIKRLLVGRRR